MASPTIGLTPLGVQAAYNNYDKLDGNEDGVIDQSVIHFIYEMMDTNSECNNFLQYWFNSKFVISATRCQYVNKLF